MYVSLVHQSHGGGLSLIEHFLNLLITIGYKPYNLDMVKARNHFRLDYTFILYIYQMFKQLLMQLMVTWMHAHSINAMEMKVG